MPAASAGAIFQDSISSGKFHGITWPQTPRASLARQRLAFQKLGEAGVEVEMPLGQGHVDIAGLADRFAGVEGFEHGEEAGVFLQEPRQRVEHPRPAGPAEASPLALRLRAACRHGRDIDILLRWPVSDGGEHVAGGRVLRAFEPLARAR